MGWELDDVEQPFVEQLQALGWQYLQGSLDAQAATGRTNFAEVIQEGVLREHILSLNPGPDGQPWLDDARLSEAVGAVTCLGAHKLMEANEKATQLMIKGMTVEGLPGWDGGRGLVRSGTRWVSSLSSRTRATSCSTEGGVAASFDRFHQATRRLRLPSRARSSAKCIITSRGTPGGWLRFSTGGPPSSVRPACTTMHTGRATSPSARRSGRSRDSRWFASTACIRATSSTGSFSAGATRG